jgi:hypothetical protein
MSRIHRRTAMKRITLAAAAFLYISALPALAQEGKPYSGRDQTQDGVITGLVLLDGKAPELPKYNFEAEKTCHEAHKDNPVPIETIIVGAGGEMKNAFVYITKGAKGWTFDIPKEPVEIVQENCLYKPHVVGMIAGQPIKVGNKDAFLHNIHSLPKENDEFNFGQANVGEDILTTDSKHKTFSKQAVMVKVKCDIHDWMGAWIGVRGNPFFCVTGDDGRYSISGVPAGKYDLIAWHEFYGNKDALPKATEPLRLKDIDVKPGASVTADFTFKP